MPKRKKHEPAYTYWRCLGCLTTFQGFVREGDEETTLARVIRQHALDSGHSVALIDREER